jgi:hypothetical protein
MAEAPSSKQHVAVPGMCNTGNTCYLNAALQAMASSQLLCDGISQLAGILQASSSSSSAGQQQSAAGQLLAVVKAAVKFILHGGWQLFAVCLIIPVCHDCISKRCMRMRLTLMLLGNGLHRFCVCRHTAATAPDAAF